MTMKHPSQTVSRRLSLAALAAAGSLALAACGGASAPASSSSSAAASSATATTPEAAGSAASSSATAADSSAAPLTMTDAWTKATGGAMTGSFGTLENTSDAPVHVVAVTSDRTDRVELHEMAADGKGQMTMQQSPDGFTVPAGGTFELVPGGDHVMFMGLTQPVKAGAEVSYTLKTEDGRTLEVTSVARPFTGADESYHGGEASSSMSGMGMNSSMPAGSGHADH